MNKAPPPNRKTKASGCSQKLLKFTHAGYPGEYRFNRLTAVKLKMKEMKICTQSTGRWVMKQLLALWRKYKRHKPLVDKTMDFLKPIVTGLILDYLKRK